jgi:hypothetical protein
MLSFTYYGENDLNIIYDVGKYYCKMYREGNSATEGNPIKEIHPLKISLNSSASIIIFCFHLYFITGQ